MTTCNMLLAGLFDNALSDYLWARAVLLIGNGNCLFSYCFALAMGMLYACSSTSRYDDALLAEMQ